MPITVRHEPSAASTGAVAYGAGRREKTERLVREQRAQANVDRQFKFQKQEAENNRASRENMSRMAHEQKLDIMGKQLDYAKQQSEFDQEMRHETMEYKYTAQQKAEQSQLQNSLHQIDMAEEIRPEEKAMMKRQVQARLAGFNKVPQPKEESQWPEGQNAGQIWNDPSTGKVLTRNKDGDLKELGQDPKIPTMKDVAGITNEAYKNLTTKNEDGTTTTPDPSQVASYVKSVIDAQRLHTPGPSGSSGADENAAMDNLSGEEAGSGGRASGASRFDGMDSEVELPKKPMTMSQAKAGVTSSDKGTRMQAMDELREAARNGDEKALKALKDVYLKSF